MSDGYSVSNVDRANAFLRLDRDNAATHTGGGAGAPDAVKLGRSIGQGWHDIGAQKIAAAQKAMPKVAPQG